MLLKLATTDAEASAIFLGTGQLTTPPTPNNCSPDWCECSNCRPMQTETENTCCGQKPEFCKSDTPGFEITIFDQQVFRLSMLHRNDLLAEANLAQYGRLGKGVRRIMPSCLVLKISRYFPDPEGQYMG